MPEIISCPQCQRKLQLPDELMNQTVRCPSCATEFVAQPGEAAPPPLPPNSSLPAPYEQAPPSYEDQPRRRPPSDWEDDEDYRRERRRRRRDLAPHRGGMILVLGILAICGVASLILGPIAWILGNNDLKEIREGRMDPEGEGQTNGGRICGMIATILHAVLLVGCCLFYIIIIAAAAGARH